MHTRADVRAAIARTGMVVLAVTFTTVLPADARHGGLASKPKPPQTARLYFQTCYNKADLALAHKDLDGAMFYDDPSFVETQPGNVEKDMESVRYRLSSWLDESLSVRASSSVITANMQGVNGTVTVRSDYEFVLINPDTHGKDYFSYRTENKDSWARDDQGDWVLLRSQVLTETAIMDGHKVYDIENPFTPAPPPSDLDDTAAPPPDNSTPASSN
ncbi:MAG: hypothetical protein ACLQVD_17185 [Capsulimonadaceae bacterium]